MLNFLCRDGVRIGDNCTIKDGSTIECVGVLSELGEGLSIGSNVGISQGCFLQVRGRVSIGDDVIFGPGVKVFSENHNIEDDTVPIREQGVTRIGVIIEDGVWLGAGCTILDGVSIGKNSVVAAGSIVTKSVGAELVVAGVPARVIRKLS